jgi:hypothetical protein
MIYTWARVRLRLWIGNDSEYADRVIPDEIDQWEGLVFEELIALNEKQRL